MDIVSTLRQFKIGPFAMFDIVLAYLGIFILAPLLTRVTALAHLVVTRKSWLWLTLPLSIIVHLAINQKTPLMNMILDMRGFILTKIIIIGMAYMGIKDIAIMPPKRN